MEQGFNNDDINRMLDILKVNPELSNFVRDFDDPRGFMWTDSSNFNLLLNLFYADGHQDLDSGIVYLCRHVQQLLKNNN